MVSLRANSTAGVGDRPEGREGEYMEEAAEEDRGRFHQQARVTGERAEGRARVTGEWSEEKARAMGGWAVGRARVLVRQEARAKEDRGPPPRT